MNWSEFFAMGGYARYVWAVYAIAVVVLAFNAIQPILRRRAVLKRLRDYYRLKSKTR
jgi:heme exporter protein D